MEQVDVNYDEIRESIPDGAVLLYRAGWKPSNRIISIGDQSPYAHAGMACWHDDRLWLLETLQFRGGREIPFREQVRDYPGRWDVYEVVSPDFNPAAAVAQMRAIVNKKYGWKALFLAAIRHMAVLRWFFRPNTDDKANGSLPFCSMAVSRALRAGGIDPVNNWPDTLTTPGDLGRSVALQYRCTLFP